MAATGYSSKMKFSGRGLVGDIPRNAFRFVPHPAIVA
jgi:hypothetical protein